jgi:hypothetical protein
MKRILFRFFVLFTIPSEVAWSAETLATIGIFFQARD